jgi:hypothetical protein
LRWGLPGGSANAAFIGLPGNPAAVFVTFARVVRPLLLRLAGALPEPLIALPVRAAFGYKKRTGRREYVRVSLRRGANGDVEAVKYPKDGAGIITSLTETDGLVELDEKATVLPGDRGFLPTRCSRVEPHRAGGECFRDRLWIAQAVVAGDRKHDHVTQAKKSAHVQSPAL